METYLPLTVKIIYEKQAKSAPYVAYTPELDISSAGPTQEKAIKNLQEAVRIVLEGAAEDGNLKELLIEAGFEVTRGKLKPPRVMLLPIQFPIPRKITSSEAWLV